jgi:hypothetical protein
MAAVKPQIRKWRRWLKRIEQDQLQDLLINQHFFHQFRDHITCQVGETEHAEFAEWIVQIHTAFVATAIRRIVEKPRPEPKLKPHAEAKPTSQSKPKSKSISLRILLEDMAKNDIELTRERFLNHYRGSAARGFGDRDFNRITRKKGAPRLTASRISRDIKELERACKPVHRLVNKVVAHTEEDRRKIGRTRYGDFDKAIEKIVVTFQRYALLLNGKTSEPLVPVDDYDISDSLNILWPRS